MTRFLLLARALVYASGFVAVWGGAALAVRPFDAAWGMTFPQWAVPLGSALLAGGAALAMRCVWLFVSVGRGTPAPFDAPRQFVALGPYRWVRNPMYVGGGAVLLGAGLIARSPAIALLAPAALLLAHLFVLLYEERTLRARFGDAYERYLREVPRWVPRRPATPGQADNEG